MKIWEIKNFLPFTTRAVKMLITISSLFLFFQTGKGQTAANTDQPLIRLTRGPYLQKATSSSLLIHWRTDSASGSVVRYGKRQEDLAMSVVINEVTTEHIVQLTGLEPYTRYYYSIGFDDQKLQGDGQNYFFTLPVKGSTGKYSFWVVGDCGNNSVNQMNVRDQFYAYRGNVATNGWLLLGDNAYWNGTDQEYSENFFSIYGGNATKNIPIWPAPGNHDYAYSGDRQIDHKISYFDIFDLPTKGEAGGVPSGTEAFYSFDYGNIHFLSLDSYGKEDQETRLYDTLGAQVQWIKRDLEANSSKWIIAYWHHPPYTMGSHSSDHEYELASIRSNFIRILERYGVDLIICGHSHSYERSKLMKGHYGNEASFNADEHNISKSSGRYDGTENSCTYLKDSLHPFGGTVYVVSGTAGQIGGQYPSFPHEAMNGYSDITNGGSLLLEIEDSRLDAKWINADSKIRDRFTIIKDAGKVNTIKVALGDSITMNASWKGDYIWTHDISEKGRSSRILPDRNITIVVADSYQCIADTFRIEVSADVEETLNLNNKSASAYNLEVFPNPFNQELNIAYTLNEAEEINIELLKLDGTVVSHPVKGGKMTAGKHTLVINGNSEGLSSGIYVLKVSGSKYCNMMRINYISE